MVSGLSAVSPACGRGYWCLYQQPKEAEVGDRTDDLKGKAKEKAGQMTDNERLEREGQADQAKAGIKREVDDTADKVKDGVDRVTP